MGDYLGHFMDVKLLNFHIIPVDSNPLPPTSTPQSNHYMIIVVMQGLMWQQKWAGINDVYHISFAPNLS